MFADRKKYSFTLNIKADLFDFEIVNTRSFAITLIHKL